MKSLSLRHRRPLVCGTRRIVIFLIGEHLFPGEERRLYHHHGGGVNWQDVAIGGGHISCGYYPHDPFKPVEAGEVVDPPEPIGPEGIKRIKASVWQIGFPRDLPLSGWTIRLTYLGEEILYSQISESGEFSVPVGIFSLKGTSTNIPAREWDVELAEFPFPHTGEIPVEITLVSLNGEQVTLGCLKVKIWDIPRPQHRWHGCI